MPTVSLCMIVKNEEDVLARCLSSVKNFVDEIIIVDTGSADKTKEIAFNFTNKVYDFVWQNDFSLARNYSFSFATSDYVMWLDADDILPKNSLTKLLELKPKLTADTYMLKYDIAFENNIPIFSFYRERILKNCNLAKWQGCVHECITPFGKIERLNISIEHHKEKTNDSDRNLKIYQHTLKSRSLNSREQYYYGRELFDHKKYKQCISVLNKFIKSKLGWVENVIDAHYILYQCYKQLNLTDKAFNTLLQTFKYDSPRANICCKIGDFFMDLKKYENAIYWHKLATTCQDVTLKGGFVEPLYYNYYPYLQLCKIYYELGNVEVSAHYNNLAGIANPSSEIVKQNKLFFKNLNK